MADNKAPIAKAYVQVLPSTKGIKGSLTGAFGSEGSSAGDAFGGNLVGTIKNVMMAAGLGEIVKEALLSGADLQQSLGGVETLFKDSADIVIANAEQAYKTAGMSANQYMETVTGFSASLLQGLSGDTQAAAEVADMALTDMADNANKMGTSMELIQNAYQGFAKQNYTMLDNLKLGYGGTKTEMERLLADAQKLTGIEYDIDNLADVYEAIHVIQEEMRISGLTAEEAAEMVAAGLMTEEEAFEALGTTAKESATTFTGSLASMKAAASDLLANLTLGRDIGPSLTALGDTVYTFIVDNLLPMAGNLLSGLPEVVSSALSMAIGGLNLVGDNADTIVQMGTELVTGIAEAVITAAPYLVEAGLNVVSSLGEVILSTDWTEIGSSTIETLRSSLDLAAVEILGSDGNIVQAVLDAITARFPDVLESGVNLITEMANGLLDNLPAATDAIGVILTDVLQAVLDVAPSILENGFELIGNLASGILENLPAVLNSVSEILSEVLGMLMDSLPDLFSKGIEFAGELASGLLENLPAVIGAADDLIDDLLADFVSRLPELLENGFAMAGEFAAGLIRAIPDVLSAVGEIVIEIIDEFGDTDWLSVGKEIVNGIVDGLWSGVQYIIDAAWSVAKSALNSAKKALGINSPSRAFRDEVGKQVPPGIAEGVDESADVLNTAMDDLSEHMLDAFHVDFTDAMDLEDISMQKVLRLNTNYSPVYSAPSVLRNSNIHVNVYAAEGMDVNELAEKVARKIRFEVERAEAEIA